MADRLVLGRYMTVTAPSQYRYSAVTLPLRYREQADTTGWASSRSAAGDGEGDGASAGKGVASSGLTFLERLAASRKKKDERHDGNVTVM